MANGHGGKRPGSGRPRKSLADKILDGSTKKHKAKVLNIPNIEDIFSPEPPEYLRHFNAIGITNAVPKMEDIYKETAEWLEKTDCLHLINPALITHYSLLITRWMECEDIVSRALIMKNEKKKIIANPMAAQALQYKKAADIAWDRIWAIVAQNCESYYGGNSPHEDLEERAAPPSLYDVFSEITNHPEYRTQKQQITDVKLVAQTLIFIQTHNIETLADMAAAVQNFRAKYNEMHNMLVSMSRRYHTLIEHIAHAENYAKHIAVYKQYAGLKGDNQDAYWKKHGEEIQAFTEAHKYISRHLNGRNKIPLDDWKRELAGLTAQRDVLLDESDKLTAELWSAETIKRNADKVMGADTPKQNRAQGLEL